MSFTVLVSSSSARHIARRVVLAMEQRGYWELVDSASGSLQFEHRSRPRRFFRMIERVERADVAINVDGDSHSVTVSGPVGQERQTAVEAAAVGASIADAVLELEKGTFTVFPDVFVGSDPSPLSAPRTRPLPPKRRPEEQTAARSQSLMIGATVLQLRNGTRIEISGSVTIGRNPTPAPGSGRHALGDIDFSVSKTHAQFEPGIGGVTVTDLGSANGTRILRSGVDTPIQAHTPTFVEHGITVFLGDLELVVGGQG